MEKVIETLPKKKKKKEKLFQWFYNNFLHANPKKCHFLTNNSEKTSTNTKSERILSSSSQKLQEYILLLNSPFTIMLKLFVARLPINEMHCQELRII